MSKKDLIAKLLAKLSEEDLEDLLGEDEEDIEPTPEEPEGPTHTHTINNRRGKGHSKASKAKKEKPKTQRKKGARRKRAGKIDGVACRVMPMDLDNRTNTFDQFIKVVSLDATEKEELEAAAEKDSDQRKKRTKFKMPARANNLVDIECCICGDEYEVSSSLIQRAAGWKCNNCISG